MNPEQMLRWPEEAVKHVRQVERKLALAVKTIEDFRKLIPGFQLVASDVKEFDQA